VQLTEVHLVEQAIEAAYGGLGTARLDNPDDAFS
jgi:hypothetical protein